MKRRRFNVAVPLLLLLIAVTPSALWALTQGKVAYATWQSLDGMIALSVGPRGWRVAVGDRWYAVALRGPVVAIYRPLEEELRPDPNHASVLGFERSWEPAGVRGPGRLGHGHAVVPHWFLTVIAPVPLLLWVWRQERRRNNWFKRGLCPWCGYDLRGATGRCPECGSAAPRRAP